MGINPLSVAVFVAPAAVIGALVFVWIYQDQTETTGLERDRMRLESAEFDRDFSRAWNGEALEAPADADLVALRAQVDQREQSAANAAQERCQRLAELADTLTGEERANNTNCEGTR